MALVDENTVPSEGQLKNVPWLYFENYYTKGLKILFVGNSITRHRVKEDIGWFHNWGMAASAEEKDYVHLCMAQIRKAVPDATYGLCMGSEWERNWPTGDETLSRFEDARNFGADIIIMRLVENCPKPVYEKELFAKQYDTLIRYLNPTGKAFVVITTGFWPHPADEAIREVASRNGYPLCELNDLCVPEMKAIGLFEHPGVAAHPGDKGMEEIAERLFHTIKHMI